MSDDTKNNSTERKNQQPDAPSENQDNIIRLPKNPEARQRKRRRLVRLLILVGAVLLVIGILLFVLLPEVFDFYAIRRYFHYMGKRDKADFGEISFDASGTNRYAALGEGLAIATEGGLYLYDLNGTQQLMVQASVASPNLICNGEQALCYAVSGSYTALINGSAETLLDTTLGGSLLDADLSRDGYLCYNLTEEGYKTVATVLNQRQEPIYRFRSSTQYLSACAVSEGGAYLAVAGLTEQESSFNATLTMLKTDEEIIAGTDQGQAAKRRIDLGNEMVYDMSFLSRDRLCVIGQDTVFFVNTACEIVSSYDYSDAYLRGCSLRGDGYLTLLLGQSMSGDRYTLLTFDKNGELRGQLEITRPVRSIDAAGSFVAVLTDDSLTVYTDRLREYTQTGEVSAAMRALMREDGTALLVSNGFAELFIP